jgi:hypothetical protein
MSRFHSQPIVQYVNGNSWLLMEEFRYDSDLLRATVVVPEGFLTDFASVPRFFWRLLPKTEYGPAAVVHDCLCRLDGFDRALADRVFKEALELLGAPGWRVWVMYRGVRIGAWWQRRFS